jgi:hypothetical protein
MTTRQQRPAATSQQQGLASPQPDELARASLLPAAAAQVSPLTLQRAFWQQHVQSHLQQLDLIHFCLQLMFDVGQYSIHNGSQIWAIVVAMYAVKAAQLHGVHRTW